VSAAGTAMAEAAGPERTRRLDPGITDLRAHAARGTLVNSAFSVGLAGVSLLQRLSAVAFVTPAQFGLWGLIMSGLVALALLKKVGINDKYVQQSEPDQALAFQKAFTMELAASTAFFVLALVGMPLYGLLYGHHEMILPGIAAAFAVVIAAFQTPALIPYRQLRYARHRALIAIDPIMSLVATLVFGALGFGYWCLVIGVLVGATAGAIVCVSSSPYRLRVVWDRETVYAYARFSLPLFGSGVSRMVVVQGSLLAANKSVGLVGIGAIGIATGIAAFADRVDRIVGQTLYPAVCAVRDRRALMYEAFVKSNRIALMWGLSFGVGLALFAADLVTHVYGDNWGHATALIAAIGLVCGIGQTGFNWTLFLRAMDDTRPIFAGALIDLAVFFAVALPAILVLGLDGWIIGVAAAMLAQLVVRGVVMRRLFPGYNLLVQFARAAAPLVPAVAAVLLLRLLLPGDRTLLHAGTELCVYAYLVISCTVLLERSLVDELIGYLKRRTRPRVPAGMLTRG
jgi:O-antigen/teichoic acid export membrane protein